MSRRKLSWLLAILILANVSFAEAQQAKKVPKVGILLPWSPAAGVSESFLKAFRLGLHELV